MLSFNELQGFAQAHSGDYRFGLDGRKKACCSSCAHNGPCEGDSHQHGLGRPIDINDWKKWIRHEEADTMPPGFPPPARSFSPAFSGLRGATVLTGEGDMDDPLDAPPLGYKYVQTTKPNTTVMAKPMGVVPKQRRRDVTRMIEELEFLAATPGVHPRALASKIWQARKALMESQDWSYASYSNPRMRYDSKRDLEARLASVERVLGVGDVSPKTFAFFYGMGGLGRWQGQQDPIKKLAQCIQGAICFPKGYCCPSGTHFDEPYYDDPLYFDQGYPEYPEYGYPETGDPRLPPPMGDPRQPPPFFEETWGEPRRPGETYIPGPKLTERGPVTSIPGAPITSIPGGSIGPAGAISTGGGKIGPANAGLIAAGGVASGAAASMPNSGAGPGSILPGGTKTSTSTGGSLSVDEAVKAVSMPNQKKSVQLLKPGTGILSRPYVGAPELVQTGPSAQDFQEAERQRRAARPGWGGGDGGGSMVSLGGLSALQHSMNAARIAARRRRR